LPGPWPAATSKRKKGKGGRSSTGGERGAKRKRVRKEVFDGSRKCMKARRMLARGEGFTKYRTGRLKFSFRGTRKDKALKDDVAVKEWTGTEERNRFGTWWVEKETDQDLLFGKSNRSLFFSRERRKVRFDLLLGRRTGKGGDKRGGRAHAARKMGWYSHHKKALFCRIVSLLR